MNIKDIDNDKLNITEERKHEIDNILKETEARVRSGEVKKNSLKEISAAVQVMPASTEP